MLDATGYANGMFSIWISDASLNWFILLQKKVLAALEDAGIFTSGGLIKDKVKVIFFFFEQR